jgi:hypothetical protein
MRQSQQVAVHRAATEEPLPESNERSCFAQLLDSFQAAPKLVSAADIQALEAIAAHVRQLLDVARGRRLVRRA